MTEFQKRVATGLSGFFFLLALMIWGGFIAIWFISIVIAVGMITEFVNISFSLPDRAEKKIVLQGITVLLSLSAAVYPKGEVSIGVFAFLFLFTYFLLTASRYEGTSFLAHCQELMYSVFGLTYLAVMPLFLPTLRREVFGRDWVLLFFLIVWAGDTGAYFAGKRFGRRKLYAKVSPKKTIEGAIGGILTSVLVTVGFRFLVLNQSSLVKLILVAILVCVVSQVGDLCESLIKRAFDKKDSGSILPGHGGFLDRFDSVVFSLPIMYACARYLSL